MRRQPLRQRLLIGVPTAKLPHRNGPEIRYPRLSRWSSGLCLRVLKPWPTGWKDDATGISGELGGAQRR